MDLLLGLKPMTLLLAEKPVEKDNNNVVLLKVGDRVSFTYQSTIHTGIIQSIKHIPNDPTSEDYNPCLSYNPYLIVSKSLAEAGGAKMTYGIQKDEGHIYLCNEDLSIVK